MGSFIAVCRFLKELEFSEKELSFIEFVRASVSVRQSFFEVDRISDSFGFCHSFLLQEQFLSFLLISNILGKNSCVRHLKFCQKKFGRRHVLKSIENLYSCQKILPPNPHYFNPFYKVPLV